MENKEKVDAFINMINENNKKIREKETVKNNKEVKESTISKFRKKEFKEGLIAIATAAALIAGGVSLNNHIKNNNSYDGSKYYKNHKQIVKAIELPDTTTLEFLTEQGYNLSKRDESYLNDPTMISYLNKIHDNIGPDYEQVKNLYGDVVNLSLEEIKSYLREEAALEDDTEINIQYNKNGSLKKDELRITYYGHVKDQLSKDEGILLVSDEIKSVIARVVEAQNFAMEKGEGEVGNTNVLNQTIAGILELDDQDDLTVIKAIDQEFKETHK